MSGLAAWYQSFVVLQCSDDVLRVSGNRQIRKKRADSRRTSCFGLVLQGPPTVHVPHRLLQAVQSRYAPMGRVMEKGVDGIW